MRGYLALPPLAPQELQAAIASAIAKQIPCSLSEVKILWPSGEFPHQGPKRSRELPVWKKLLPS